MRKNGSTLVAREGRMRPFNGSEAGAAACVRRGRFRFSHNALAKARSSTLTPDRALRCLLHSASQSSSRTAPDLPNLHGLAQNLLIHRDCVFHATFPAVEARARQTTSNGLELPLFIEESVVDGIRECV